MATLVERAIGAARLDAAVYEEVEADQTALGQAMTVVVVAAVAAGIGTLGGGHGHGLGFLVLSVLVNLVGWFVWALLAWWIGTRLLPVPETQADVGQLLRTTGFSASPGVLKVLGILPAIGGLIVFVAGLWQLAAMVVAIRQALDYTSTWRAVGVCAIGFVIYLLVGTVLIGTLMALGGGHGAAMP
jgi:uncharacterized membrane protein YidH (DUF202 family)